MFLGLLYLSPRYMAFLHEGWEAKRFMERFGWTLIHEFSKGFVLAQHTSKVTPYEQLSDVIMYGYVLPYRLTVLHTNTASIQYIYSSSLDFPSETWKKAPVTAMSCNSNFLHKQQLFA